MARADTSPDRLTARAKDERLLHMLDLRDHEGLSQTQIGLRLGISRGGVAAALQRMDKEPRVRCLCRKPENRDGGMPRRWWRT